MTFRLWSIMFENGVSLKELDTNITASLLESGNISTGQHLSFVNRKDIKQKLERVHHEMLGQNYKTVVLITLFATFVQWFRTLVLMPVGWVDPKSTPFHQSFAKTRRLTATKRVLHGDSKI